MLLLLCRFRILLRFEILKIHTLNYIIIYNSKNYYARHPSPTLSSHIQRITQTSETTNYLKNDENKIKQKQRSTKKVIHAQELVLIKLKNGKILTHSRTFLKINYCKFFFIFDLYLNM